MQGLEPFLDAFKRTFIRDKITLAHSLLIFLLIALPAIVSLGPVNKVAVPILVVANILVLCTRINARAIIETVSAITGNSDIDTIAAVRVAAKMHNEVGPESCLVSSYVAPSGLSEAFVHAKGVATVSALLSTLAPHQATQAVRGKETIH